MQQYEHDPNPILFPAPPHSVEAERSVIGALLQDTQTVPVVAEQLSPEDFYSTEHNAICRAVLGLYARSSAVDLMTVGEYLGKSNELASVGGAAYLLECIRFVPTTANIQSYIDIVKEKSSLRKLLKTAQDIQRRCYEQADGASSILSSAEAELSAVGVKAQNSQNKPVKIKEALSHAFDRIEENCRNKGAINGIPTGFYDLDRMLTGLHPGELVIVGGRPAMGKTSFGLSVAHFASVHAKKNVLFFSLEMPCDQLATRILSFHSRVPMQRMRSGDVKENDWAVMGDALNAISNGELYIDDTSSITPTQIRSKIRSMIASGFSPHVVIIDYLGILSADQKSENRQQEVSAITRQLKALARELKIPFVVLAQLSRAATGRGDKRPVLTDLRETGNIEAEADVVIFVHREGYYDQTHDPTDGLIIVAKQRNGPVGDVSVRWDTEIASYQNKPGTIVAQYK